MHPTLKAQLDRYAKATGHKSVDRILAADGRCHVRNYLQVVANPGETKPPFWADPER